MAEMTNIKTWSKTRLEGTGATTAIANRDLFWKIKNHLKTVGWTVLLSCDGVTGHSTSDLWASGANIVCAAAGVDHSWIVLGNDSICTGFQLCIDFSSASNVPREAGWYISTNGVGFTSGGLLLRPTATDEAIMKVYDDAWTYYSSGTAPSANVWSSSDNQNYTIFLGPTTVRGVWAFGRAIALKSFWTKPCYAMVASGGTGSATYAWHDSVSDNWTTTIIENETIRIYLGTIMTGSTIALTYAGVAGATGDANGAWPVTPVWLISSSPYYPGILGIIPDLWWLHSNATLVLGDTFPADDSKQQVVIGNFGVGNDGYALTL